MISSAMNSLLIGSLLRKLWSVSFRTLKSEEIRAIVTDINFAAEPSAVEGSKLSFNSRLVVLLE